MSKDLNMITDPLPKLIWGIAAPASTGFFFNTMYNVIDTFFAGLISTQALASLSLSIPVFFIIIALGTGISTGTTALIGNALGAGRGKLAKRYALQGLVFGIFISLIMTYGGLLSGPYLFSLLGASKAYLRDCLLYMNAIFSGSLFFMMNYMFNSILNALGDTRSFRNFLIGGFFANIALDPWFINGGLGLPAMGIAGIGFSTVLVQFCGGIYLSIKTYKTEFAAERSLKDIIPSRACFIDIARQGFPASISMITVGVGFFVITYFAGKFGKEAVAAYGVATRIEQIILLPTIGLNIAALTLIARNNGAGRHDRVGKIFEHCLRQGFFLMLAGTVLIYLFAEPLMELFTKDKMVISMGRVYLRIGALIFYAYVILFVSVAALQGIKKPIYAIWIGIVRQLVLPLTVFHVTTYILNAGILGVWWGLFSINWSAAGLTFFYTRHLLNKVEKMTENV